MKQNARIGIKSTASIAASVAVALAVFTQSCSNEAQFANGNRLSNNGAVKQNGNTSQFIFTPEEQIEYASGILSLETGDIFVCGTCGGVGQGTNTFLNAGDVMETEVEGLGQMRNKFVAEKA